jgi:hypothetical protein
MNNQIYKEKFGKYTRKIEKYNNELNYFFENSRKIEENLQEILKKLKM